MIFTSPFKVCYTSYTLRTRISSFLSLLLVSYVYSELNNMQTLDPCSVFVDDHSVFYILLSILIFFCMEIRFSRI